MQVTIRRKNESQQTHRNVKDIAFYPHGDPNVNALISIEFETGSDKKKSYLSIQKQYSTSIEAVIVKQPAVKEMVTALQEAAHLLTHLADGDLEEAGHNWGEVEDAVGAARATLAKLEAS